MDKLKELDGLQTWLNSKYKMSLDEFDIALRQYGLTLKQLLLDYEEAYNSGFDLPLINYVITEELEE